MQKNKEISNFFSFVVLLLTPSPNRPLKFWVVHFSSVGNILKITILLCHIALIQNQIMSFVSLGVRLPIICTGVWLICQLIHWHQMSENARAKLDGRPEDTRELNCLRKNIYFALILHLRINRAFFLGWLPSLLNNYFQALLSDMGQSWQWFYWKNFSDILCLVSTWKFIWHQLSSASCGTTERNGRLLLV